MFSRKDAAIERLQREFALIVACRAVNSDTPQEVQDYMNLILIMFEYSGMENTINDIKDAADNAAYGAAYRAAYNAAEHDVFVDIIKNLLED